MFFIDLKLIAFNRIINFLMTYELFSLINLLYRELEDILG